MTLKDQAEPLVFLKFGDLPLKPHFQRSFGNLTHQVIDARHGTRSVLSLGVEIGFADAHQIAVLKIKRRMNFLNFAEYFSPRIEHAASQTEAFSDLPFPFPMPVHPTILPLIP